LSTTETQSPEVRKRLRELVEYVEELVRQAEKPAFTLTDYKNLLYYESDLKGQVGVHHDLEDEDGPIWLKIERLKRTDPPLPPEAIRDWVTVSRDPFREPVVEALRVQTMHNDDAAKLVARGMVTDEDVQPALKGTRARDQVDVVMRLERFEEVRIELEHSLHQPAVARVGGGRKAATAHNRCLRRLLRPSASHPVRPGASNRGSLGHRRFTMEGQRSRD
jgi:hypothetical protein